MMERGHPNRRQMPVRQVVAVVGVQPEEAEEAVLSLLVAAVERLRR